ncbi:MAG TPA: hypothetical protein VK034_06830, partial [Enhygromyxa sp.]|nr:hypothetical protein [Enhygromyxa sp.]
SKKEALDAKARREQNWALREDGKRLPSEVLDQSAKDQPPEQQQRGPNEGPRGETGAEPAADELPEVESESEPTP